MAGGDVLRSGDEGEGEGEGGCDVGGGERRAVAFVVFRRDDERREDNGLGIGGLGGGGRRHGLGVDEDGQDRHEGEKQAEHGGVHGRVTTAGGRRGEVKVAAGEIPPRRANIGRRRSQVLKLFRRLLGVSAKLHLVDRQLREARELLLSTTLPISEIGKAVGLSDPYHFSKLFRKHVGLAPRVFRAEHGPFSTPPKPSSHQANPPATPGKA